MEPNASAPMAVTDGGMVTDVRPVYRKALLPIRRKRLPMVTDDCTPLPMVTDLRLVI